MQILQIWKCLWFDNLMLNRSPTANKYHLAGTWSAYQWRHIHCYFTAAESDGNSFGEYWFFILYKPSLSSSFSCILDLPSKEMPLIKSLCPAALASDKMLTEIGRGTALMGPLAAWGAVLIEHTWPVLWTWSEKWGERPEFRHSSHSLPDLLTLCYRSEITALLAAHRWEFNSSS